MSNISKLIAEKKGNADLLRDLEEKFSGSELNSLLLELFRRKAQQIEPAELLKAFEKNRFVQPSTVDAIAFKELELRCLQLAKEKNFTTIELSPLTVFGTCSAVAFVDQNNVVSASRGTEVVSDATNVFAMLMAQQFKKKKIDSTIKYAATHRHVRSQALSNPAFTAHFGIFCLATGGMDTGNFSFELEHFLDHINLHLTFFMNELSKEKLFVKVYLKDDNINFHAKLNGRLDELNKKIKIEIQKQKNAGDYYKLAQFKFFLEHEGKEINLSDGGFVDWTQKLIPNKKHRLIISGIGTELLYKIKQGQL